MLDRGIRPPQNPVRHLLWLLAWAYTSMLQAAAVLNGVSAWRKLIYSLSCQSVMWRQGKLRFPIGVKHSLPIGRPRPRPLRGRAGRQIPDLRRSHPFVTHPATLSRVN